MYLYKTNIWITDKYFTFHMDVLVILVLAALSYVITLINNFFHVAFQKYWVWHFKILGLMCILGGIDRGL